MLFIMRHTSFIVVLYNEAMKKLWFKAKPNGWGWYPASTTGWVVTLVYFVLLAWSIGRFSNFVITNTGTPFLEILLPVLLHALWVAALIASLLYLCIKFGEEPLRL